MDAAYFAALDADHDLGRTRGIDATLQMFGLDAILLPTDGKRNLLHIFLTYSSPLMHAPDRQDLPLGLLLSLDILSLPV